MKYESNRFGFAGLDGLGAFLIDVAADKPMRPYDPTEPLIFVHVPKCAGTTVRAVFRDWFVGAGRGG